MKKVDFRFEEGEPTLRQIRKSLGITQQELAHRLGTGVTTIRRWENGTSGVMLTIPQIKKLIHLLDELGLTIDELPDRFGPPVND